MSVHFLPFSIMRILISFKWLFKLNNKAEEIEITQTDNKKKENN